ncbi:MAG: peptidoglycan DD-metalloendopeptidase family protein [bacterium]|nr:peptidoglycan DD-metalloendopeptidase family protein [bacterium]
MNKTIFSFKQLLFLLILVVLFMPQILPADYIADNRLHWKPAYVGVEPLTTVKRWKVPFNTGNRTDIKSIRVISTFGSHRNSYLKGHIHTGVDCIPKQKTAGFVYVYPMARGVVCSIHLGDPHRTIVVKHKLANGDFFFTSYKHLQEIYPRKGQQVNSGTKLGRLYTRQEALAQGGNYDHLHLETRKRFDDFGVASWATLTKVNLNLRFYDPMVFMKDNVKITGTDILIINPCIDKTKLSLVEPVKKAVEGIRKCRLITLHYKELNPAKIIKLLPEAVIITGQYSPWALYNKNDLNEVLTFLKETGIPVLGICGGHQLIGMAFDTPVASIKGNASPRSYDDLFRLHGVVQSRVVKRDPILEGLNKFPKFSTSHCEELKHLPVEFDLLIENKLSPIYMMKHKSRDIYGVQFHPENSGSTGGILLRNFIDLFVE